MISCREADTEYLGGYITKITHYDEWDEWISRTCTETVTDGYDEDGNPITHEEEYDCSYREYHPQYWTYTDNLGKEIYFYNEEEFKRALKELGYPKQVFRDMHRNYYQIDGDAQDYYYDGTIQHLRALTTPHVYKNKVIASESIFKFEDISKEDAKKQGLFEYPEIIDNDQEIILGLKLGKSLEKKYKYINSIYGKKKQFRIYVLIFKNKPIEISETQKSYWQGGNKNEFILCLGYNTKRKTIEWCNPFSWCDDPKLEIATKRYFREHKKVEALWLYPRWLETHLGLWKRKEFADFNYIDNTLTQGQSIGLFILVLILNILISFVIVNNENFYKGKNPFMHFEIKIDGIQKSMNLLKQKIINTLLKIYTDARIFFMYKRL